MRHMLNERVSIGSRAVNKVTVRTIGAESKRL